jgi:hypothetical protein
VTGHGTGVAGNVCAAGNNGTGVASPAWACKIMPIRVTDINGYASLSSSPPGCNTLPTTARASPNASFAIQRLQQQPHHCRAILSGRRWRGHRRAGNDSSFDATADDPYCSGSAPPIQVTSLPTSSATATTSISAPPCVNIVTTMKGGGYG